MTEFFKSVEDLRREKDGLVDEKARREADFAAYIEAGHESARQAQPAAKDKGAVLSTRPGIMSLSRSISAPSNSPKGLARSRRPRARSGAMSTKRVNGSSSLSSSLLFPSPRAWPPCG